MTPVTDDRCGRRGFRRAVVNGMLCCSCSSWFHETCTGLSDSQYLLLSASDREFRCMACITHTLPSVHTHASPFSQIDDNSPASQSLGLIVPADTTPHDHTGAIPITNPPAPFDGINNSLKLLLEQVERHGKSIADLADGVASLTYRIYKMEDLCNALPLSHAATKADELTSNMIETAAAARADASARAKNIMVRGLPYSPGDAVSIANALIAPILPFFSNIIVTSANWFFRKDPKAARPLLISFATAAQRTTVLQARRLISECFRGVQIYPDRPLSLRLGNRAQLPPAAQLNLTPTNPGSDKHAPSAAPSEYHSP
jgi:hypothetical protein